MEALVYHGPGQRAWEHVPEPMLRVPTDAIVRIDTTTICGTDLHILKGDVPEVAPGTILGHEAVGTIEELGSAVTGFEVGDRVLISCITSCGRCPSCRQGRYGLCTGGGGWILGHLIDGVQAERARIPFVDTSAYKVPEGLTDEQVLFLADILPTSYEVGILNGRVKPGDVVAIVGAGPIGLAAVLTAKLYTPATIVVLDVDAKRLELAKEFGADVTIDNGTEDPVARMMELTEGRGADVAIEALGIQETFENCLKSVRPAGMVSSLGVYGDKVTIPLEPFIYGIGDIDIRTTLCPGGKRRLSSLMNLVKIGRLDLKQLITHRFSLDEIEDAYPLFSNQEDGVVKVTITP
jgi:alcohol dehydrogenase